MGSAIAELSATQLVPTTERRRLGSDAEAEKTLADNAAKEALARKRYEEQKPAEGSEVAIRKDIAILRRAPRPMTSETRSRQRNQATAAKSENSVCATRSYKDSAL